MKLAIGLALLVMLSASASAMGSMEMGKMMMHMMGAPDFKEVYMEKVHQSLSNATGDDFDNRFIHQMIVHHRGAMEMAQAIRERTNDSEIRNLADRIVSNQTHEVKELRGWHEEWGLQNLSIGDEEGALVHVADILGTEKAKWLSGLESKKADTAFLMAMIMHHSHGVMLAEMAVGKAGHEELKRLSQNIIDSQTQEIGEMHVKLMEIMH